jgi:type IX secretion system PorP/SprF family membrane protein
MEGQMVPVSANYLNNILAFNPAFAGSQDALSTTISYRNQWTGFRGAPKSSLISAHTPIKNDKIGLGLIFEINSFGINKETRFCGNYSYRIDFHQGKLALGLGFGATMYNIAWNELDAVDQNDILLSENPVSKLVPYFNLGSYYYNKSYFIGISIPMLLNNPVDKRTGSWYSGNNYFIAGGYMFGIAPRVKFLPSALLKIHSNHPSQLDLNAQLILQDRIWVGIGYRSSSTFVGMLQLQLNPQLKMAYSYDYDLGPIGRHSNGSHEIVLNYVFNYYRKVVGPRQF